MVSTNSSQYATDFNNSPTGVDTTKSSPLSLLAKTCEAIGLPDTPASKKTPKKDENSPGDVKKSDSPNLTKRKDGLRSPRATPKTSSTDPAAALAAMGLPKGAAGMFSPFGLPMGFPMGFHGMLPYPPMPYPSFPIPPFMRCPSMMLGRPCTNPSTCPACSGMSGSADAATLSAMAAASSFPGMPQFAYPFMPSTSTAASLPATYQQMLQAAAAASVSSSTPSLPVTTALPASVPTPSTVSSTVSTPSPASIKCQWSSCNKTFASADELDVHFKAAHNPSPRSSVKSPISSVASTVSSTSSASGNLSSTSSTSSSRYHPYSKPGVPPTPPVSSVSTPSISAFPFAGMSPFPAALTAMYQQHQRLMGIPHP